MARWIYCFREGELRDLSEDEKLSLLKRYRRTNILVALRATLCVPIFLLSFMGAISLLMDRPVFGWPALIGCIAIPAWMLTLNSRAADFGRLCRRAARLGTSREWIREDAPDNVRAAYSRSPDIPLKEDDDNDFKPEIWGYWKAEEEFDESLERSAKARVIRFETVADDGVILTLNGALVRKAINAPIVEIRD